MTSQTVPPIVVGFDGSARAALALSWALVEASRVAAPVRVIQVVHHLAESTVVDQVTADAATLYPDLTITSEVRTGSPATVLCEESRTARMLVIGTRSRGGLADLFADSVSVSVVMQACCPVIAVRQPPPAGETLPIVVGVDDSAPARFALGLAYAEAASRGVGLIVLRAWRPPVPDPNLGGYLRPEEAAEMETAERRFLHDIVDPVAKAYPGVRTTIRVMTGSPGAILAEAAAQAQLAVVGSRRHGNLTGRLLGSAGLYLLHHSPCPVAIVHEPE